MKRYLLLFLSTLMAWAAQAAPPRLQLEASLFRNTDGARKGGVLELYATVDGNSLTYQRRAPKIFQASAELTLDVLAADGTVVYTETLKLKPPVLRDTTQAIKNPMSFQKRVLLDDGTYTVRGLIRDQYKAGGNRVVEVPIKVAFDAPGLRLSDVVLLAKPASRSGMESNFIRSGLLLVRTPGGLYGRGADRLYGFAELYNGTPNQPMITKYRIRPVNGTRDAAVAAGTAKEVAGGPHLVIADLDISKLPAGEYDFIVEVRGAKNKLLTSKTTRLLRQPEVYAPAAAVIRP